MVRKTIILFAAFLILFFFFEIYFFHVDGEEIIFKIERGEGVFEISQNLKKEEIIRSSHMFTAYVLFSGKRKQLKAGSYLFSSEMSIFQIAEKIFEGDIYKKRITIIEGWNLNDIANYIEEQEIGTKDEFYKLAGRPPYIEGGELFPGYPGIIQGEVLEGFLFPDTYYLSFSDGVEEAIKLMLDNFKNKVGEESLETIIIASLIEKEVRSMEDKRIVSGIIKKRMEIGMPLQIDATIIYLTGKRTTNVSIEETKINSSYNTYLYLGLPEKPICNPGLFSIQAALIPQESDYLYYLSKPTGETVFSRTLEEHNIAKNKYLR